MLMRAREELIITSLASVRGTFEERPM